MVVLVIAALLTPSTSGVGTHTQLGLPPCGFLYLTGFPCPGCGLTTAFAHLAHGHVSASVGAHPLGLPLFLLNVMAVFVSAVGAIRAWPLQATIKRFAIERVLYVLAAAAVGTWLLRLISIFAQR